MRHVPRIVLNGKHIVVLKSRHRRAAVGPRIMGQVVCYCWSAGGDGIGCYLWVELCDIITDRLELGLAIVKGLVPLKIWVKNKII